MTAPTRREHAATLTPVPAEHRASAAAYELWQEATAIRQEWLGHGLSTRPADRPAAEHAIAALYARISRPRPRFTWVDSPAQALPLITGLPTLDELYDHIRTPRPPGPPSLASDLATAVSRLRTTLGAGVTHPDPELSPPRRGKAKEPWPELPPRQALTAGVPFPVLLHQGIRAALHHSLIQGVCLPVRAALAGAGRVPVCWYGQQDLSWIAYYDTLRRLGLARYGPDETDRLAQWAALARSGGWWWPGEQVCVVVDRPAALHTQPVPGTAHERLRLAPAGVRYRDGWHPPVT